MKKIILVGKAGSGKDFFRDFLSKHIKVDVSFTTRPKRNGETDGYTYNYITESEFRSKQDSGFFVESVVFNKWSYGTSLSNWNTSNVFIKTPSGLNGFTKEELNDMIIVYFDIDESIRRTRLEKRSDSDKVERRILADKKDFESFRNYDIRVVNPEFDCEELFNHIKEIK